LYLSMELRQGSLSSFGFKKVVSTYSAPLVLVLECYSAIGTKKELKSVEFAITQVQKKISEANHGFTCDVYEAMAIAWVIRLQQLKRLSEVPKMIKCAN